MTTLPAFVIASLILAVIAGVLALPPLVTAFRAWWNRCHERRHLGNGR